MTAFTVKDSGKRVDFASGMHRDTDEGKPRYDLLIPLGMKDNMLRRWAVHMGKGIQKYGPRNWEKARGQEELDRFMGSAFRHFIQWFVGDADEDHASAVYFNIQGAEYVKWRMLREQGGHIDMVDEARDVAEAPERAQALAAKIAHCYMFVIYGFGSVMFLLNLPVAGACAFLGGSVLGLFVELFS